MTFALQSGQHLRAYRDAQDPKKFARGMQLLQLNEEIKTAKKVCGFAPSDAVAWVSCIWLSL